MLAGRDVPAQDKESKMSALLVPDFSLVKTSTAEKAILIAEARSRFKVAIAQLDQAQAQAESLVDRCDLVIARIDLIQAYSKAVSFICRN